MLSACVGGPTYGTHKSSAEQFFDDLSNIATIGNLNKGAKVDSRPRPELVLPSSVTETALLPVPQENVANVNAPDWPESPEQRRERIRKEATKNQNNPNYITPIIRRSSTPEVLPSTVGDYLPDGLDRAKERQSWMPTLKNSEMKRQNSAASKKTKIGGSPNKRVYLSEPPLDYRQPALTAPIGEKGDDEAKKERERNKAKDWKPKWWPF